jgi:fatty-acyl-CoA synthase
VNAFLEALRRNLETKADQIYCRQISAAGEVAITWRDLGAAMGRFGRAYRDLEQTGPSTQILIFLRHVPDLYGSFFGAMASGLTPAFLPCASPRQDPAIYWGSHRELLAKIKPLAIVTDSGVLAEMKSGGLNLEGVNVILADKVIAAPLIFVDSPESAIGLLQHSSGTTGLKKGVALSYQAIVSQLESYAASIGLVPDDLIASWLPLYHDMGLIACMIMPAYFGIPVIHIDPFWWVGRPASLFDVIARYRGTLCWLPNFAFEHLAATAGRKAGDYDLSTVRAFINCSEPVKAATFEKFAAAFAASGVVPHQLQCCYAMAETVFAVSQTEIGALPTQICVKPQTTEPGQVPLLSDAGITLLETGTPISGMIVDTVDDERRPLPSGAVGEIRISGDFVFTAYNGDPETTADRLQDGYYYSRDIGFLRDGKLYVLGRADDLIIINGRNLYAHEVESTLAGICGLKPGRAVAIAVFDARVGSHALVILAEAMAEAEREQDIKNEIANRILSTFEVTPRAIELMREGQLIKTTSGKISRSENHKRYMARNGGENGR